MIDRIHMGCDKNSHRCRLCHFFYTIHSHENWRTVVHLGVGRIQGNNLRLIFFDGQAHAVIPEGIARRVERLFSRSLKNNTTGLRWKTKFLIIVGRCFAISMQGFCPLEGHIAKVYAFVRQRRHIGKSQSFHVPVFLFGLNKHWHRLW